MLNHKVEMYVPRNTDVEELMMTNVFQAFCQKFGMATVIPALSGSMNKQLITTKVGIIYSYIPKITNDTTKFLNQLAVEVRETLKQESIMIVIDNEAKFY